MKLLRCLLKRFHGFQLWISKSSWKLLNLLGRGNASICGPPLNAMRPAIPWKTILMRRNQTAMFSWEMASDRVKMVASITVEQVKVVSCMLRTCHSFSMLLAWPQSGKPFGRRWCKRSIWTSPSSRDWNGIEMTPRLRNACFFLLSRSISFWQHTVLPNVLLYPCWNVLRPCFAQSLRLSTEDLKSIFTKCQSSCVAFMSMTSPKASTRFETQHNIRTLCFSDFSRVQTLNIFESVDQVVQGSNIYLLLIVTKSCCRSTFAVKQTANPWRQWCQRCEWRWGRGWGQKVQGLETVKHTATISNQDSKIRLNLPKNALREHETRVETLVLPSKYKIYKGFSRFCRWYIWWICLA